jgi:hypothetical protein
MQLGECSCQSCPGAWVQEKRGGKGALGQVKNEKIEGKGNELWKQQGCCRSRCQKEPVAEENKSEQYESTKGVVRASVRSNE